MAPPTVIGGARAGRLRAIVVSLQVAGATLLLTMASLLVRNAIATAAVSVGFDTAHGIVLEIDPASHGYAEPAAQQFVADAITTFRATPGVVSATVMDRVPFYVGFPQRLEVSVDGRLCAMETCPTAASYRIGPDYFRTMNIPLRRGRELDGSRADAQSVVISETMARSFWPSADPVGQWVSLGVDGRRVQVVGVAADTIHRAIGERPEPYVYLPFEQPGYAERLAIVLRTSGDPQPLLLTVAEQLRAMDPALPIYQLRTMRQRIDAREQSGRLIIVRFFGICGGLALFLSDRRADGHRVVLRRPASARVRHSRRHRRRASRPGEAGARQRTRNGGAGHRRRPLRSAPAFLAHHRAGPADSTSTARSCTESSGCSS